MSYSYQVAEPKQRQAQNTVPVSDQTRASSFIDLASTGSRLVPKQLKDSLTLVTDHAKSKGVSMAIPVVLIVVGLFFLSILFISLVVAMIAAFGGADDMWVPALWVSLVAFILAALCVGIGAMMLVNTLPSLVPQEVIRGVKHDMGYLAEGNKFDPVEFDRLEAEKAERKKVEKQREKEMQKQAKKENKDAIKRGEAPEGLPRTKPTINEVRNRMELRRRHLGDIRSGLDEKADVKAQLATFTDHALGRTTEGERLAHQRPASSYSTAARAGEKVNEGREYVKDRWAPLTLLGASVTAMAVFARGLGKSNTDTK